MKISLFYKTSTKGVCFVCFLGAVFMFGFFSTTSANSQTTPLLETSSMLTSNVVKGTSVLIVEDQALQVDTSTDTLDPVSFMSSSTEKITTYKVEKGDTLDGIAKKFNVSKNTILYANSDIKGNLLKVGETLIILPVNGINYTVKKGDTIGSIALKFKADVDDILEYNDIPNAKSIKIGDSIIVPGGVMPKKVEVITPKKSVEGKDETETISQPAPKEAIHSPTEESIGGYIWPLPAGVGRITQRLHDGKAVDIGAPKGSPIYAIADGTVLVADGYGYNGGYGLYVVLNFENGAQVLYGHMSKVTAVSGQAVKQGDIIGLVGSTGHSTGPHIHLEFRGGFKNPFAKLSKNATSDKFEALASNN